MKNSAICARIQPSLTRSTHTLVIQRSALHPAPLWSICWTALSGQRWMEECPPYTCMFFIFIWNSHKKLCFVSEGGCVEGVWVCVWLWNKAPLCNKRAETEGGVRGAAGHHREEKEEFYCSRSMRAVARALFFSQCLTQTDTGWCSLRHNQCEMIIGSIEHTNISLHRTGRSYSREQSRSNGSSFCLRTNWGFLIMLQSPQEQPLLLLLIHTHTKDDWSQWRGHFKLESEIS